MSTVQTLRGPIDSADMGRTLIHEHVFIMDMEYTYNYRPDFFTPQTIADAAARLEALKASGIDSIIDLTVLGLGRHVPSLVAVVGYAMAVGLGERFGVALRAALLVGWVAHAVAIVVDIAGLGSDVVVARFGFAPALSKL